MENIITLSNGFFNNITPNAPINIKAIAIIDTLKERGYVYQATNEEKIKLFQMCIFENS